MTRQEAIVPQTEFHLRNAEMKLGRAIANDGVDPVSGYTTDDIVAYIRSADMAIEHIADACLRRHGIEV